MKTLPSHSAVVRAGAAMLVIAAIAVGCHDGPMYALKHVNPYFTMREWPADEALGTTDHQRRRELQRLVTALPRMDAAEQQSWLTHLNLLMEHDKSAEMRQLAVRAAQSISTIEALPLIARGLEDESLKVRMAACDVLGHRSEAEATRLLVEAVGNESSADVRLAAVRALGTHEGSQVNAALKMAVTSRDPALRHAAIQSLRRSTGRDLGQDPETWVAFLEGRLPDPGEPSAWSRLRNLF